MIVLHGLWRADQRLALWAEDGSASGLDPATLRALLASVGPGLEWLAERVDAGWVRLLLPTVDGAALPSPELALPAPSGGGPVRLAAHRLPALLFPAAEAAQLLGELYDPHRSVLQPELPGVGRIEAPYGASLRWLAAVHDLAWRLAGRGRVLPALELGPAPGHADAADARWLPVPDQAARRELAALAADCPPVCRAEAPPDAAGAAPGGAALAGQLLAALVDYEARAVLADEPPLLRAGRSRPPATAAEHWLTALTALDSRLPAEAGADQDAAALPVLRDRLVAWHRSASAVTGPLRLGFRLVEPRGHELADDADPALDRWRLEFTLRSADDPSVLVDAAELWAGGPAADALRRLVDHPVEAFLAELERAARRRPELEPALLADRPAGLELDRAGALDFLREAAPALADAGFGVLLPAWWRQPVALGLALTAELPQAGVVQRQSLVGQQDLVAFRWQAALGDQPLTAGELAELAAAKGTLVRMRGHWLEADRAAIAAAAAFLARPDAQGTATAGELLRLALGGQEPGTGLPILTAGGTGAVGELLRRVRSGAPEALSPEPVAVPPWFGTELRPYQQRGLAWLVFLARLGLGGVLADDMGLGKTVQTLALLAVEHDRAAASGPTLVVCPMSLVGNWQRECARFAPRLRVHVHHGAGRPGGRELRAAAAGADVVITTYGLVLRDFAALRAVRWHRVVADEAHHLKNSAAQQSRAVRALPATHRLALTGTPVENRLAELHSVLDFANPGLFGSAERFKERYSVPIERNSSPFATAELRRRTRPFVLRRVKSDPAIALDLPRKQEMTVLCNLTAEQAGLYQAVVDDLLRRMARLPDSGRGLVERKGLVLAALTRLKQICNHPAHYTGESGPVGPSGVPGPPRLDGRSGKLARLEETLREAVAEGDRILCFTQFTRFGELLRPYLAERLDSEVLFLHGGLGQRARDAAVDRFQDPDGPSVFLLSLKAGGRGLNLTAANQVVHIDRWWNPAVEEQATDRAFRLGQRRDVQVRRFVCVGTVEERVDAMIEAKRQLADAVVGAGPGSGEGRLGELPLDALREVLALTEDAVSEADAVGER
ncbi:DEAD/DEAH box helicase [Streptacidiphilus sp. P02-A3a]|uniref:DEAD/DEAH box helicase n=1 Tax=Streptacidiphilus sp. P02-A3a TaxID=2704468 RepID=UPI0015FA9B0B|nr:DEAD/DEAH box helicase [Streptacidiphilus sp. P02-A3a]QMU69526.1 DEAD/DEAH box helicase [Streptacidiphilus sp. P02-A3a]